MNERIVYENNSNYSQLSYGAQYANRMEVLPINPTPYANANVHDLVPHVTDNYS
jgi:hypothetical protein